MGAADGAVGAPERSGATAAGKQTLAANLFGRGERGRGQGRSSEQGLFFLFLFFLFPFTLSAVAVLRKLEERHVQIRYPFDSFAGICSEAGRSPILGLHVKSDSRWN